MHQINMRMAVTLLKDSAAVKRAKEKAEAPTVKTEEQARAEEKLSAKEKAAEAQKSVWRRRFRPLPENKAVDLFADVIGDVFILLVASGLLIFEYTRSSGKPDTNAENIAELDKKLKDLERRETELEESEKKQQTRVETLEQALEEMKKASARSQTKSRSAS
jgi:optic atrophy 3 protein